MVAKRLRVARALFDACHPGPTATVTLVVTTVAAAAGRDREGLVLVAAAVLTGQLSVGWCNDARDADRDSRAGRAEKPTVRGDLTASILWRSAFIALALCVVLSYAAAGAIGGTAHVVAVISAWSYNLVLKTTLLSALPYAVSFGLAPAFVTYGLTPPLPPTWWITLTCALMGVGAHFANALPDIDSDRAVSAGGLVAAIGVRRATIASLACLLAAVVLLLVHLPLPQPLAIAMLLVAAAAAVIVAVRGHGRTLFRFVMVLAAADVVMLVSVAARITA